ncbi:MAG: iron-sulfur cluster assembly protein [Terracidiphilus sp.]|jgi:metal-sulfur cluster biosynthetic enzyme
MANSQNNDQSAPVSEPFRDDLIWRALKTVRDPEIPVDIVNLGLIYAASSTALSCGGHRIDVRMSLTAPGCSMSDVIKAEVEHKLAALPEVREVHVDVVFDPLWNPGMMSEAAKLHLGFDSDYGSPAGNTAPTNSGPFSILR